MTRPPPQPIFVHHGLEGGATSCAIVSTSEGSPAVLVGTGRGRCELYDAETHFHLRTVYVDAEERSISAVGALGDSLWVHVRHYAMLILGPDDHPQTTLELSHCGYCRATTSGSSIVYPDTEKEQHFIKFWTGDELNTRTTISLKHMPLSIVSVDELVLVGDESGTVQHISPGKGIEKKVSLFSEPIFCLAGTSTLLACGSSKPPLVILPITDIEGDRKKINYPSSSRGVGSMAFSTSGKTLLAGFWDGSIRAFSVQKLTILLYLDLHSKSISQLIWSDVMGEDRIVATSLDEKMSLWKLK